MRIMEAKDNDHKYSLHFKHEIKKQQSLKAWYIQTNVTGIRSKSSKY